MDIETLINNYETNKYKDELDLVVDIIEVYKDTFDSTISGVIENLIKTKTKVDALTALLLTDLYKYLKKDKSYFNVGNYNFYTGEEKPTTIIDKSIVETDNIAVRNIVTGKTNEIIFLIATVDNITDIITLLKLLKDIKDKYIAD